MNNILLSPPVAFLIMLAAAMGFDGYEFAGTKTDQVRQIGNAVAVRTAEALCGAMLDACA